MKRGRLFPFLCFVPLLVAGCGPPHEETIRQRSELLVGYLIDEKRQEA